MKKELIILFVFLCSMSHAQTVIQMEEYNGVYRIPCSVNGAKMKFIFDTGASSVCLSMTMAEYLLDNDFISKEDILGTGSSSVADGRIVNHVNINIKDIEIQGTHLSNVKAIVVDGQNAPLLMGQSAIQKLGAIEIKGSTLIIKNGISSNNEEYINGLLYEAKEAFDNNLWARAIERYSKLYSMNQLSENDIYNYALSCHMIREDEKAEMIVNSIKDFSWFEKNRVDVYCLMGHILTNNKKYTEAVNYFELSSKKIVDYVYPNIPFEASKKIANMGFQSNFMFQGDCYYYSKMFNLAAERYWKAALAFANTKNVDINYILRDSKNRLKKKEVSYREEDIDYILCQYFVCEERSGEMTFKAAFLEIAAMARAENRHALKLCNDINLNPYSEAWNPHSSLW